MRKDSPKYTTELARVLRKNQTEAETMLWQRLRNNRFFGYKFRRQYAVGRYIVDFYCSIVRLAIEIDGDIHSQKTHIEYDELRDKELTAKGITVLRFSNNQITNHIEDTLNKIHKEILIILVNKQT